MRLYEIDRGFNFKKYGNNGIQIISADKKSVKIDDENNNEIWNEIKRAYKVSRAERQKILKKWFDEYSNSNSDKQPPKKPLYHFEKTPQGYYHKGYYGRDPYFDELPGYRGFQGYNRNPIGSWEDILHFMDFIIKDYRIPEGLTGDEIASVLSKEGKTNPIKELKVFAQTADDPHDEMFKSWNSVFKEFNEHHKKRFASEVTKRRKN